MASHCTQCGATLAGDALFCPRCGSRTGAGGEAAGVPETRESRRPSAESIASGEQRLLKTLRDATLGEYEVLSEIGRGGMAVVFLAHDIALNRRVAIKCMAPALMLMDKGIQERFKREARTAASLSHPHIIPVYAVKESRDLVYFVMKYVEGRSLESVIKEVGPLPVPVIQTILNQAGAALGHAHRHGVVHRDVKPGNIMLDQDGWLVMTDFGIAKVAQAEALTMTGGMVGTPAYMSPEQCQGGEITGAADQYSLGVVAFEMLTGRPPFASATMVNVIYDHCHTPPPPIQELRADCPSDLAAAVMRMMAKDPGDRFATIEEAVAAVGVAPETQDAVRTRMLTLIKSPRTAELLDKFRTPASPAPRSKTPGPAPVPAGQVASQPAVTPSTPTPYVSVLGATAPPRRWVAWAAPVVVAGAIVVFALSRERAAPAPSPMSAAPAVQAAVARLDVTPVALALRVGEEAPLSAVPRDSGGAPTPDAVTWAALDPAIATVSEQGTVRGIRPGQARVVARSGGSSAAVVVTVAAAPAPASPPRAGSPPLVVASVSLWPTTLTLTVGETARLAATPQAADGSSLPQRRVTWASSDPRLAAVTGDGVVTAIAPGTVAITGSSDGRSAVATVVIRPAPAPVAMPERPVSPAVAPAETTPARPVEPAAPADPRPEIRQVIEQYGQAIEAEDLTRMRGLYPAMTAQQEQAWRIFFGNVSELSARLDITAMEAERDSARVSVAAVYEFRSDRRQTQNTTLTLRLRRTSVGWQIVSVQ
ncbi:MAG TPA: protein kinase [Gemmatimonadales bacterium]|nr:protein kinase [Gemmatimonadales bacterium]